MEKLYRYLRRRQIEQKDFAKQIGIPASAICRLLSGKIKQPRVRVAVAIERATKGAVKCEDW